MNPANHHYDRACLLAQQGRYALAQQEALAWLVLQPESDRAYNLLAFCYARTQQPEQAIAAAHKAIALAPDYDFHHYRLADVLSQQRDYSAAAHAIANALQLNPTSTDNCGLAASIAHRRGNLSEALTLADKGLAQDPGHVTCLNMRILAFLGLKRWDEAETETLRSLQAFPEQAFSHSARGWLALSRQKAGLACEAFKTALELDPNSEWARQGLIEALKARNSVYRQILRYEQWQENLRSTQPGVFWAFWLAIPQLRAIYWLLLGFTLFIRYLLDVALRFHPYGCLLFTEREKWLNNCALMTMVFSLLGLAVSGMTGEGLPIVIGALSGAIAYCLCLFNYSEAPSHKVLWVALASVLAVANGLFAISLLPSTSPARTTLFQEIASGLIALLVIGGLLLWLIFFIVTLCRGFHRSIRRYRSRKPS